MAPWQIKGFEAALGDLHPDVLRAALTSESSYLQTAPLQSSSVPQLFKSLGKDAALGVAPRLVELLRDSHDGVRGGAARALGMLGEHARDQVPALGELLHDSDGGVRRAATTALGALGEHAKDQAPDLIERLRDTDRGVREAAAQALGALGEYPGNLVPALGELLLDNVDRSVRQAAAWTLGALGEHAKDQAPKLVGLLPSWDSGLRDAAARALGALGEHARGQLPALDQLLRDSRAYVREAAARALQALGAHARELAPALGELLRDPDPFVRRAAAWALAAQGIHARHQAPVLGELLHDYDSGARQAAVTALGALGAHARNQVPTLVDLLRDAESRVRQAAAGALGALGEHASDQVPTLSELLQDSDARVRQASAAALGALGEHARDQVPKLGELLRDSEPGVRWATARALGALGEYADAQLVTALGALLHDSETYVREAAATALGALGEQARVQAAELGELLHASDADVRNAAARSLEALGPFGIELFPLIIAPRYGERRRTGEVRFLAHYLSGGAKDVEHLLHWLPESGIDPLQLARDNRQWGRDSLRVFDSAWPHTANHSEVRRDVARLVATLAQETDWTTEDLPLLQTLLGNLESAGDAGSRYAPALREQIARIETARWSAYALIGGAIHTGFWVLLTFAYPHVRPVQAVFFWNKWIRRIAGLGYVEILLAWVPFLRHRLFAPFRSALVADARLQDFRERDYFQYSNVLLPDGSLRVITALLGRISGQVVLQGESGLGKSMFLRHLLRDYPRLVVYLRAEDCAGGVLEAIAGKLEGPARDLNYLRSLIHAGALDIVIDGLNEVSATTRAGIVEFARKFTKGNLLITTQPIEWDPPPLARVHVLQPLDEDQIETFLIGRYDTLPNDTGVTREDFAERCRSYLGKSLDKAISAPAQSIARRVLSNPMDLSVVAQMIARGAQPNLFELQQQQFQAMATEYAGNHAGQAFPLEAFAERVYEMRLNDEPAFRPKEFANELQAMARNAHKMVVQYHYAGKNRGEPPCWTFRHDKIRDFFLVQAFLGATNERPSRHLGDSKFRGTYLQLAVLLPIEEAQELERMLIDHAADTRDHSLSDEFVRRLRPRRDTLPSAR